MNSVTKPDFGPKGSTPAILLLEKEGISFQVASFSHEVAVGDHGYGKAAAMALGVAEERVFKTLLVALHGGHCGAGCDEKKSVLWYRAQVTFVVVVFANQSVAGVPLLVPVTLTVMYLPL